MTESQALQKHLVYLLRGGGAHRAFDYVFREVPSDLRGVRPEGLPHSLWELLEHLRLAQWDILEFSRDPAHESPPWPEGYWPDDPAPPSDEAWEGSLAGFRADLGEMVERIKDTGNDLYEPLPWGDGQTLLREALLVADHNAYHLGQVVAVRRILGDWPPPER